MLGVVVPIIGAQPNAPPLANGAPCLMRAFVASQSGTRLAISMRAAVGSKTVVCETNASPVHQCSCSIGGSAAIAGRWSGCRLHTTWCVVLGAVDTTVLPQLVV